jgi:hypothetical protein
VPAWMEIVHGGSSLAEAGSVREAGRDQLEGKVDGALELET